MMSNLRKDWNGLGRWVRLALGVVRINRQMLWNLFRLAVGIFLLGAAMVKMQALLSNTFVVYSVFQEPRLQVLAVCIEVAMSLWLFSNFSAGYARQAALLLFTVLLALSVKSGVEGQSSCGCFGAIDVNPWITVAINTGILACLLIGVPGVAAAAEAGWWQSALVGSAYLVLGAGVCLALMPGDLLVTLGRLKGRTLFVSPAFVDLGVSVGGKPTQFMLSLHNYSYHPVRVVGGTSSCNCVAIDDLPIEIPAQGTAAVRVRTHLAGSPGHFQHQFMFYTDDGAHHFLLGRFGGRIVPKPASPKDWDEAFSRNAR
jgi:hypothetical protein